MPESTGTIALGIDGGGTQTRAALVDAAGTLLGYGTAGPSNYQAVGIDETRKNIAEATAAAWRMYGDLPRPADGAFLGMAGVTSATDRARIMEIARDLRLAATIDLDHDIRTALAGGLAGAPGIALIAGTGSASYGRNAQGASWRAGGWGHLLDDLGSGYWMGVRGLAAVTRAADGRSHATMLSTSLPAALGIEDMEELLRIAGHDLPPRATIAALAPLILQAARDGDAVALKIGTEGAKELAAMVAAVAGRLGWMEGNSRERGSTGSNPVGNPHLDVVMIGGLTEDSWYAARIAEAIGSRLPHARLVEPILPPALGAALLALELAGEETSEDMIEQMRTHAGSIMAAPRERGIMEEKREG